jgi:K+-sensing histidine kinase KdpD
MRNKLAGITAAASHLSSLAEEVDATEEIELSEIILGEASRLDRELDRLLTLFAYPRLSRNEVSISNSLEKAVKLVSDRVSGKGEIEIGKSSCDRTLDCPLPALSLLIESVLLSHLDQRRSHSRTKVSLKPEADHTILRIRTVMAESDPELSLVRIWKTCADQLAGLMTCRLSQERDSEAAGFTSTLRIPYHQ